jgi:hypothetical protein
MDQERQVSLELMRMISSCYRIVQGNGHATDEVTHSQSAREKCGTRILRVNFTGGTPVPHQIAEIVANCIMRASRGRRSLTTEDTEKNQE